MSRCLGIATVGGLVLALTGCTLDSFLVPNPPLHPYRQVVPGKVDEVADRIQEGLIPHGVSLMTKKEGNERRLAGRTKSGEIFCLHLYGQQAGGVNNTLISCQWNRSPDEAFWKVVVQIASAADADDSSRAEGDGK
jgi:hypothetical protein